MRTLRFADLGLSALASIVALPVIALAAVAIRLETSGPAILAQRRVGRGRAPFTCLKLRTMAAGTAEGPSHEIGMRSVTRVGAFLRRTKIDELPQLWNVLRGEMSLVGPRPCLPSMARLIEERDRHGVNDILPGVTGPAQVAGLDMSDPAALAAADAEWLKEASLRRYLGIILATVLGEGRGDAALK